jgi:hypothetical protein
MKKQRRSARTRNGYVTLYGAHAERAAMPEDRVEVSYRLEGVVLECKISRPLTNQQRERLLYEKGEGPQAPDEKPEPTPRPRDRRTFAPADRPAKAWSGYTEEREVLK